MFNHCHTFLVFSIILISAKTYAEKEPKSKTPEISEQIDPSIFIRQQGGYIPGMNMNMNAQSSLMNQVNFAFTCKCTQKTTNPLGAPPTDANQIAHQQIMQLQEQVRRQQEIINRQSSTKTGFENFTQLIALANSMECSCSSDQSQEQFPGNLGMRMYGNQGGMANGYSPITMGGGPATAQGFQGFYPAAVQRGVPLANYGDGQPIVMGPYSN